MIGDPSIEILLQQCVERILGDTPFCSKSFKGWPFIPSFLTKILLSCVLAVAVPEYESQQKGMFMIDSRNLVGIKLKLQRT